MALSGSFNTNAYNGRYLTFAWTATQSVSGNSSTISWTLKCDGTGSGYYKSGPFKVVIAGATVYTSNTRIELRIGDTVASGTKTITHNSDGTKSFSASAEAAIYTMAVNCTGSGTFTLNTIPRASSVSQAAAYIGDWANCVVSAASTAFTHDLTATFGDVTVTIGSGVAGGTTQWVFPNTFYDVIPNATSGTGTITCKTYNGSTLIGTSTCSFTVMTKEADCKPTLNPEVQESNDEMYALTGSYSKLVKYYSSAFYLCGASAKNGASIVSYKVVNNGVTMTTSSGTFVDVESGTFTFTVTDSRGYSASATITLTMVDYVKLTSNIQKANPTTSGDFTLTVTGNYFNGSFGSTSNNLAVYYRYKTGNGNYGSWTNMSISKSGDTYTATATFSGLDYQETYTFQSYASDSITSTTPVTLVTKSLPVFDWSGEDFNFNVPVNFSKGATGIGGGGEYLPIEGGTLEGNLRLKLPNSNYGGKINFGDGEYCYLEETTDDDLTIKATDLNLNVRNLYLNNETIQYGTWTPSVINTASYTKRKGWYQKVGKVVTVGFLVNGKWNSTASTTFEMYDLPFTCGDVMAAGGGIVFNAQVNANTVFCGWVVIPNSTTIGARTYAIRTTKGPISLGTGMTTYPNQTFTVSGTITYMTA